MSETLPGTKPTRRRKLRSDSAAAALTAMKNAALPPLEPPPHVKLRKKDEPFWEAILLGRTRDEWNEVDLAVAAQLARCQADIEAESAKLDDEGMIEWHADRREERPNVRIKIIEQLTRRQMAMMRTLRMGGHAAGDPRYVANKRKLERESRELREELASEHGLLAQ